MKIFIIPLLLILLVISIVLICVQKNKTDPLQAIAVANEWKWSKKEVKSYVTPREVVFKFPDGKVDTIQLPDDKFFVAVAPYINRTHQ